MVYFYIHVRIMLFHLFSIGFEALLEYYLFEKISIWRGRSRSGFIRSYILRHGINFSMLRCGRHCELWLAFWFGGYRQNLWSTSVTVLIVLRGMCLFVTNLSVWRLEAVTSGKETMKTFWGLSILVDCLDSRDEALWLKYWILLLIFMMF